MHRSFEFFPFVLVFYCFTSYPKHYCYLSDVKQHTDVAASNTAEQARGFDMASSKDQAATKTAEAEQAKGVDMASSNKNNGEHMSFLSKMKQHVEHCGVDDLSKEQIHGLHQCIEKMADQVSEDSSGSHIEICPIAVFLRQEMSACQEKLVDAERALAKNEDRINQLRSTVSCDEDEETPGGKPEAQQLTPETTVDTTGGERKDRYNQDIDKELLGEGGEEGVELAESLVRGADQSTTGKSSLFFELFSVYLPPLLIVIPKDINAFSIPDH